MAQSATAAEVLVDALVEDWGVRHIFGLPGDGINRIMEVLRKRQDKVQFIQVRLGGELRRSGFQVLGCTGCRKLKRS